MTYRSSVRKVNWPQTIPRRNAVKGFGANGPGRRAHSIHRGPLRAKLATSDNKCYVYLRLNKGPARSIARQAMRQTRWLLRVISADWLSAGLAHSPEPSCVTLATPSTNLGLCLSTCLRIERRPFLSLSSGQPDCAPTAMTLRVFVRGTACWRLETWRLWAGHLDDRGASRALWTVEATRPSRLQTLRSSQPSELLTSWLPELLSLRPSEASRPFRAAFQAPFQPSEAFKPCDRVLSPGACAGRR